MRDHPKIHWPTTLSIYFVLGGGAAFVSELLRSGSPTDALLAVRNGAVTVLITAAVVTSLLIILRHRLRAVDSALATRAKRLATELWHLLLGWFGAGLASFAIALFVSTTVSTGASVGAALLGPLAFLLFPDKMLVVLLLTLWSVGFAELMRQTKLHENHGGRGAIVEVGHKLRAAAGSKVEIAPAEAPEDAYFVHTEKAIRRYVIKSNDLAGRISFGEAHLAPGWGKKKGPVFLGLPKEGSALWIGTPGSGKSLALQTILLNIERRDKENNIPSTKVIILSAKARDLAGPAVRFLRTQLEAVNAWDLTGETVKTNKYGDPTRWSPILSSGDFDAAKRTAKRLVESGREQESRARDEFWLTQAMLLIGPSLFAAYIRGESYERALSWAQSWTDPDENDVDLILNGNENGNDALRAWQDTRKMLLSKENDTEWKEQHGLSSSGATGMSIQATMNGLMLGLATQAAYRATEQPDFNPREWIREEGGAALFLIGDSAEKGMTRSLLATMVHELLTEADKYAREQDTERLPYRLIVLGDELANLCPIPDLEQFFSGKRSTGIQVIAVFQSYGQIEDIYSREVARVLADAAAVIMIFAGIKDPQLISMLSDIGGSQRVELNEGSITTRPLIEGHDLVALHSPDDETGEPGEALLVMQGGVAKIEIPFWALNHRYDDRGEVMERYADSVAQMRRNANPRHGRWRDAQKSYRGRRGKAPELPSSKMGELEAVAPARESPTSAMDETKIAPPSPVARPLVRHADVADHTS